MNVDELRALQEPLKAKYRESPEAARIAFEVTGVVDVDSIACRIESKMVEGNKISWLAFILRPADRGIWLVRQRCCLNRWWLVQELLLPRWQRPCRFQSDSL